MVRQVSSQQTVAELRAAIRQWQGKSVRSADGVVSTGCLALDELFPAQGIRRGSLIEWLGMNEIGGAVTLSLVASRAVLPPEHPLVLIDRPRELFPLALQGLGLDLGRLVLIHPKTERDALWACEEALRCSGVGLVWMRIERLSGTGFRRLQLAAESGGTIGFFVRPEQARHQPSWAEARFVVRPVASQGASYRFEIEMANSQGWPRRSGSEILIDNVQGTIHDVSSFSSALPVPVVS